jgi:hypothetical protein
MATTNKPHSIGLPAAEKLRELVHMRPSFTTPALSPALEITPGDALLKFLWRQFDGVTARPATDFNAGHAT